MIRLPALVTFVRLLLGVEFVVNGLNWWVKLIGPYPSMSDFSLAHPPHATFVGAMIATGFLFDVVKAVELAAGIALLANRFVPLALVAVFPVTINVFLVDAFLQHHLRGVIMGSGALVMNAFLMLACLPHYAPMLTARTQLAGPVGVPTWLPAIDAPPLRIALKVIGVVAAAFGLVMLSWLGIMIVQFFTR